MFSNVDETLSPSHCCGQSVPSLARSSRVTRTARVRGQVIDLVHAVATHEDVGVLAVPALDPVVAGPRVDGVGPCGCHRCGPRRRRRRARRSPTPPTRTSPPPPPRRTSSPEPPSKSSRPALVRDESPVRTSSPAPPSMLLRPPGPASRLVVVGSRFDPVVAFTGVDQVVPGATVDIVVAVAAHDHVVAVTAAEGGCRTYEVRRRSSSPSSRSPVGLSRGHLHPIVAWPPLCLRPTRGADQIVAAFGSDDELVGRCDDHVVAVGADQAILCCQRLRLRDRRLFAEALAGPRCRVRSPANASRPRSAESSATADAFRLVVMGFI